MKKERKEYPGTQSNSTEFQKFKNYSTEFFLPYKNVPYRKKKKRRKKFVGYGYVILCWKTSGITPHVHATCFKLSAYSHQ